MRERERGKSGAARVLVDDLRDVNRALNRLNLRHVHRDLNHLFNMNGWKTRACAPTGAKLRGTQQSAQSLKEASKLEEDQREIGALKDEPDECSDAQLA